MDSGETHEPSYYEVALTNRQVLIAFVALLTCLLVAFLSGVWIGRGGAEAARAVPQPVTSQAAAAEPQMEQLTFFNGDAGKRSGSPKEGATVAAPAPAPAPPASAAKPSEPAKKSEPDASDAMRENLEATMAANRETPAMKLAVGERTGEPQSSGVAPPDSTAKAPTAAKPAAKPATATAPTSGKVFVQVYSSTNGSRAKEILAQLRKAGFAVVMAEIVKGGATTFRVRVGPYDAKSQADQAATRLRRDHRLDTWVTDSP